MTTIDLQSRKVGIIGFGVMGEGLVKGMLDSATLPASALVASDISPARLEVAASAYGLSASPDNLAVVRGADVVVLAVKPQDMAEVLAQVGPAVTPRHTVVSIAAGVPTSFIEGAFRVPVPVVRVMPNLPCVVREGALAFCLGSYAGAEQERLALALLGPVGKVVRVEESLMDAVTGLSGSGPAFVFLVIEALADAGVRVGFSRQVALSLAAHTVLGAARMVIETGSHPATLKDRVASPGGTAIAGLHALERGSVRASFIDAVVSATERAAELGRTRRELPVAPAAASAGFGRRGRRSST